MEIYDNSDNGILVTNIQRFSLHDGPGIRTTVFLKGCDLQCPWCCNPENRGYEPENYIKDGREGVYGRSISCVALYKEVIKDRVFYDQTNHNISICNFNVENSVDLDNLPGGVTFSGGEALIQIKKLVPLLKMLKNDFIHTAVETCLFISQEQLITAIDYIDLFYVDAKILDKGMCKKILSGDLESYFRNLDTLFSWRDKAGYRKPVVIRVPVIGGFTDSDANRKAVVNLIGKYRPIKVEIIKEHNLGTPKYKSLGIKEPAYIGVNDDLMERYKREIETTGVPVEICKI